jgi:hypothetical protein
MLARLTLAAALALAPVGAFAHHGWSSYDAHRTIRITLPVTKLSWSNPHGTATAVWQKRNWKIILAPVARMEARGLTREMLSAGKPVTLVGYPRKDGTPEMRIERVIVDGKAVELR